MRFARLFMVVVVVAFGLLGAASARAVNQKVYDICLRDIVAKSNDDEEVQAMQEAPPYPFGVTVRADPRPGGARTVPVFCVENPPVSSGHFHFAGEYTRTNDESPSTKARLEVTARFFDGTSTVQSRNLPDTSGEQFWVFNVPVESPANTWPVEIRANLVIEGGCFIRMGGVRISQEQPPATTMPSSGFQAVLPGERIVQRFNRSDEPQPSDALSDFSNWNTWGQDRIFYSTLFDGVTHSAIHIAHTGRAAGSSQDQDPSEVPSNPLLTRVQLINADSLVLPNDHFAVVGVFTGGSDGRDGEIPFRDVQLQLLAQTKDGHRLSTTCRPFDTGADGFSSQAFRLPITNSTASPVTHLELFLLIPGGAQIIFDEIGVALAVSPPAKTVAPAVVEVPPGKQPVLVSSPLQLDTDVSQDLLSYVNIGGPLTDLGDKETGARQISFLRSTLDDSPRRIELLSQDAPNLKAGTFGITGAVSYEGLQAGTDLQDSAWFELTSDYADGTHTITATTAAFGAEGLMKGHSSERPFAALACSVVQPVRVRLDLLCRGTGRVRFSPLSLVQYEPIPAPASVQSAMPPAWWTLPRFTRLAGFALLGVMAVAAIAFLIPAAAGTTGSWLIFLFLLAQGSLAWAIFLLGKGTAPFNVTPLLVAALAWLLPLTTRWIAGRRVRKRELRKIYSLDVAT